MLAEGFRKFLEYSAGVRPDYPRSLGKSSGLHLEGSFSFWPSELPPLAQAIYSQVRGTKRLVDDQSLMDFVPGFRLFHIDEIPFNYQHIQERFGEMGLFPLLGNYSSDYYCLLGNSIVNIAHDSDQVLVMQKSPEDFLATICEFYRQGVFFLDQNGYLDYDMTKEGFIGVEMNPDCDYWID